MNCNHHIFIRYSISVLYLMFSLSVYAQNSSNDSVEHLSGLEGADMTIYGLYSDYRTQNKEKSVEYAELFLSHLKEDKALPELVSMNEEIAEYYENEVFLFSKAIAPRLRLDGYYQQLREKRKRAVNQYRLAVLYYQIDQYHKTLYYINDAYDYFKKEPLSTEKLDIYNLLGITFYMCQDYSKSNQFFSDYAHGARELKDTIRLVKALANSTVYTSTVEDNIKKTESIVSGALALSLAHKDTSNVFELSTILIDPYIQVGNYEYAENLLDQSAAYMRNIKEKGFYYLYKGFFALNKGNDDAAVDYFIVAIENYNQGEFKYRIRECLSYLHPIFARKGEYRKAYEVLQRFNYLDIGEAGGTIYLDLFKYRNEMVLESEREQAEADKTKYFLIAVIAIVLLFSIFVTVRQIRQKASSEKGRNLELENERLQLESARRKLESKNEVLALREMRQKQTDRCLDEISDRLNRIIPKIKEKGVKEELADITSNLNIAKSSNKRDNAEKYIPEFNTDFYKNIIHAFPNLTVNERRLCVLLNKNLSTKEISQITMQSENTIKIARGRLRGKLGLTGENLSIQEFLSKYE